MSSYDTGQRILRALSLVTPKPISQLVEETGLSYGTVRQHLTALRAERITNTQPHRYLRPEVVKPRTTVQDWRVRRERHAEEVRTLVISEHADPAWLADQFIELGTMLLKIGSDVDRVKMDPDWYIKLGGRFWLSDREEGE